MPGSHQHRAQGLESRRPALGAGDDDHIKALGHRMKGVGVAYGFAPIAAFGKTIEDSAKSADKAAIGGCIEAYADYLAKVQIVYE